MKILHSVCSPACAFGSALSDLGLRVREEFDELSLVGRDFELRLHVSEQTGGSAIRCFVSITEGSLAGGAVVLFNEIALEGYPLVAIGSGRGKETFEFTWFQPEGADWRISAERCQGLIDRVTGGMAPVSLPIRQAAKRRPAIRKTSTWRGLAEKSKGGLLVDRNPRGVRFVSTHRYA